MVRNFIAIMVLFAVVGVSDARSEQRKVTDAQLGELARAQHEVFNRVQDGSLPVEKALAGLRSLLEGEQSSTEKKSATRYVAFPSLRPTAA